MYLYSVWRNKDDRLVILDGTAEECARFMGVTRGFFYKICNHGGSDVWTIEKKSIQEIEKDVNE